MLRAEREVPRVTATAAVWGLAQSLPAHGIVPAARADVSSTQASVAGDGPFLPDAGHRVRNMVLAPESLIGHGGRVQRTCSPGSWTIPGTRASAQQSPGPRMYTQRGPLSPVAPRDGDQSVQVRRCPRGVGSRQLRLQLEVRSFVFTETGPGKVTGQRRRCGV